MDYKCIAVDIATYAKFKNMAEKDGRTMGGELRFLMNLAGNNAVAQAEPSVDLSANHKSEKQIKLEQMVSKLKSLDEDSPEYEELLHEIENLQKES